MKLYELENRLRQYRGQINADEGIVYGDPAADVTGVLVCWMGTREAVRRAQEVGANTIISHEAIFFPYPGIRSGVPPADQLSWCCNRQRIEALARAGVGVIRLHGTMDRLHIFDEFPVALGFPEATVREDWVRLYDLPATTVRDMVGRVKERLKLDRVRVSNCDLDRPVRRVALPLGGTGLFVNVGGLALLARHSPDLFIAGETDEYALQFCIDGDIPLIETSHAVSEEPGVRVFADRLAADLKPLPVTFFRNGRAWMVV
jgi:putative NIF3 family GTP cyclohydrolase 1 type 2